MANFSVYKLGQAGVNITKDPFHLADEELVQAQNAEIVQDSTTGGEGALSKRSGLAVLNSSPMSGSVLGIFSWPIKTTFTRTLYASRGTATANTFMTSTDGTTWTNTAVPTEVAAEGKFTNENDSRDARRIASFKTFLIYPSNSYTQSTDNPPLIAFDGTTSLIVTSIAYGPSSNAAVPFAITDCLVANGKVYIAMHDQGGSGANIAGRVVSLDLTTGKVTQIANGFGPSDKNGGQPSCMAFYQNQLFVGLNGSTTTNGIGTIVRCYPDTDTTWTTDVSNLVSHISTLALFKGNLYAGTQSSTSTGAQIYERTATGTAWTSKFTSGGGAAGSGVIAAAQVYNGAIYMAEYHSTTPIIHIKKSTDGTTWTTDRDVDANDGAIAGNLPRGSIVYNNGLDLYYVFSSTTTTATDGIIMQLKSGTWTKVKTENFLGPISVLVQKTA